MSEARVKFTQAELLHCVIREVRLRERVYPSWINQGRIKLDEAERQIAMMRAVMDIIGAMPASEIEILQ
jgi:hypothetical protein